ncbi:hypothetical protein BDV12DRAFT_96594 [Aspergillus spectabilis]
MLLLIHFLSRYLVLFTFFAWLQLLSIPKLHAWRLESGFVGQVFLSCFVAVETVSLLCIFLPLLYSASSFAYLCSPDNIFASVIFP